jgi:multicomponent Na+:H+ antiporter subunit F
MDSITIILYVAAGFILLALILALFRFIRGPHTVDRIIAFDVMSISGIALIALVSLFMNRIIYLDVAIVYGLLGFIGVVIIAKYLERSL